MKRAAIITINDKWSKGERVDTSGSALVKILERFFTERTCLLEKMRTADWIIDGTFFCSCHRNCARLYNSSVLRNLQAVKIKIVPVIFIPSNGE